MTDKSNTAQTLQPPEPGEGGVKDQAEAWLAYLYSGAATDAGRRRFSQWLREAPEHAAAYAAAEQLWQDLGLATAAAETPREADRIITPFVRRNMEASVAAAAGERRYRLRMAFAMAATLVIATAIVGYLQFYDPNATRYATAVGEIETVALADGSQVTLSGDSRIVARITEERREVELTRGRAYFDVVPDEQRRLFRVRAAATEIRVLGTAFDVNRSPDGVRVSVAKGKVQVTEAPSFLNRLTGLGDEQNSASPRPSTRAPANGGGPDSSPSPLGGEGERSEGSAANGEGDSSPPHASRLTPHVLTAGQQLLASLDGAPIGAPERFNPEEELSWKQGRLRYVNTRLSTVVDEVNRYRQQKIVLADDTLGDFRVTTSFKTDETDQLLSGLTKSYPVTIARNANKITVQAQR